MELDKDLIDELLAGYKGPEDLIGEHGLLKQLTKALVERALNAELTHHLGYEKHDPEGRLSGNSRNGTSRKKLKGDFGEAEIAIPRDRNGSFTPQIVPPHRPPRPRACRHQSPARPAKFLFRIRCSARRQPRSHHFH
jgi:putative transposase